MANNERETVHPVDQAVYQSGSPRVAVKGTRYGHGACTILWMKATDNGWVLLPHGVPTLAVHLPASEFTAMLDGLRIALRLGNVYDPRQDPHGEAGVVAIFCGHVARGETPTIYGDGKQTRDYVYVADAVDAFLAATHYTGDEVVFNIGTGNAITVGDLLDVINDAAGTAIEPNFAPARAGEWRHGALDSAKAAGELNWTPATSITAGIRETYQQLTR